jgi:predicted transcriptional regulator
MSATSLKLPADLKQRLDRLAARSGQTPHGYMVSALAGEVERAELRERFAADAAESEREAIASGKSHSLTSAFDYLAARVSGKRARPPRARSWRASK